MKSPFLKLIVIFSFFHLLPFLGQAKIKNQNVVSIQSDTLEANFLAPPAATRPHAWWRWYGGQITRDGITRDMEAFKRVGYGGVQFFQESFGTAVGASSIIPNVTIFSPEWWNLVQFAIEEANRCGVHFTFQNCLGYSTSGGPWITPELSMQKLVWSTLTVTGGTTLSATLAKPTVDATWNYYKDVAVMAMKMDGTSTTNVTQVVDVSTQMAVNGSISWVVPAGSWKIIRIGHTTTGKMQHPVPTSVNGLECDKMNRDAVKVHFDNYPAKIIQKAGAIPITVMTDSYEAGPHNWTPKFRDEFIKRRGYDPLPWLPALNSFVLENSEKTTRFKYDMNRTIEELMITEHYKAMGEYTHQYPNIKYEFQPYNTPFNLVEGGTVADNAAGEFWHVNKGYGWWTLSLIASVSHFTGNPIVTAESFTAEPQHSKWDLDAYALKTEGDLAFANGVNSMQMSVAPHQPWDPKYKPGMVETFGSWFNPNNTWWEQSKAWLTYLSRCQYLLRQGKFVGDICYLYPNGLRGVTYPAGYNGDAMDASSLIKLMSVADGRLITPGGASYRLLYMQENQAYTVELVRKIKDLVANGAVIIGPKPLKSVSLSNYPTCDSIVKHVADSVWGNCNGTTITENSFGAGKVYWGKTIQEVLTTLNVTKDFDGPGLSAGNVAWTHRRDGSSEIYFVSNQQKKAVSINCNFRVSGLIPEIWNAETGEAIDAPIWSKLGNMTTVKLNLTQAGSCFVVFRRPSVQVDPVTIITADGLADNVSTVKFSSDSLFLMASKNANYAVRTESGLVSNVSVTDLPADTVMATNWKVTFPVESGINSPVTFPTLTSWTRNTDKQIKYFSGTATYSKDFVLTAAQLASNNFPYIDLGTASNFAEVVLNGKSLGVMWKPPYKVDITDAAIVGLNHLEIKVTNTFQNRMIGDEQEPDDVTWKTGSYSTDPTPLYKGKAMSELPAWFLNGTARPSTGRKTFTNVNFYFPTDSLLQSGIIGPVKIGFFKKYLLRNFVAKPLLTSYYVRPTGDTLAWKKQFTENPEQVLSLTNVNSIASLPEGTEFFFSTGSYACSNTTLSGLKVNGGFSGKEAEITDLNKRVREDNDANGIVEPWEFKYPTYFQSNSIALMPDRMIEINQNAVLDGVTLRNFICNLQTPISIGTLQTTVGTSNAGTAAKIVNCTVDNIMNSNGNYCCVGLSNGSKMESCLVQNSQIASNLGVVWMLGNGTTISKSVFRNNKSATGGFVVLGQHNESNAMQKVENCLFVNNTTGYSVLRSEGTNATGAQIGLNVVNSTFYANTSTNAAAIVDFNKASGKAINLLLHGTTPSTANGGIRKVTATATVDVSNVLSTVAIGTASNVTLAASTNYVAGAAIADLKLNGATTSNGYQTPTTSTTDAYANLLKANYIPQANHSLSSVETFTGSIIPTADLLGFSRASGASTLGGYQVGSVISYPTPEQEYVPNGLNTRKVNSTFQIYPNPVLDRLNVVGDGITRIEIFNENGVKMKDIRMYNTRSIVVSDLPKGIYYVRVIANGNYSGAAFLKK
jgi:hypothetical protein